MEQLTVSIVNYRTPALVVECVTSLKQFAPHHTVLNIVVIDNASGDNSADIIQAAHPDIQFIASSENLGFAGGNNLGLRDCRSDWVLLLNSDAQVIAGTLDTLLNALRTHPRVGAVSAQIVNATDGAEQDFPERFPSLPEMVRRALSGPQYPATGRTGLISLERLHGACLMMRGELLQTVGLLDDGFFMYDEDVDWCVRARQAGWDLCLVPESKVLHHGGKSSGRAPNGQRSAPELSDTALRMKYELRRSRYRLYRKHRSLWELAALKLMTDLTMVAASVRPALNWLHPSRRAAAQRILRSNARIMALNPFVMEGSPHGNH